jgi:hypothetical protein
LQEAEFHQKNVYIKALHMWMDLLQVLSTGPSPEWDEVFAWAFDSPPKGQKLHISCKNKSSFGKVRGILVIIESNRAITYSISTSSVSSFKNLYDFYLFCL